MIEPAFCHNVSVFVTCWAVLSPDAGCRESAASAVLVEAFNRPVAMAPPAGTVTVT